MDQDKLKQFKTQLESLRGELEAGIRDESGQTDAVKLDGTLGRLSRMDAMQSQAMARAPATSTATIVAGGKRAATRRAGHVWSVRSLSRTDCRRTARSAT